MTTKELEDLKYIHPDQMPSTDAYVALRSAIELIEKQPVTMDGVIVVFGAEVICPHGHMHRVTELNSIYCYGCETHYLISECFSTRSAALAAAKKEG